MSYEEFIFTVVYDATREAIGRELSGDVYFATAQRVGRALENIEAGGVGLVDLDTQVRPDDGSIDDDLDDWYTVKIVPKRCIGCGTMLVATNVDFGEGHMIVVWPTSDDPSLLKACKRRVDRDGSARVVAYERSMGRCISFYALDEKGYRYK